jgi:deferrochelatase/peroxidase EfeB
VGGIAVILAREPVETADIQGLVAAGYGHLRAACFLLLRIAESEPTAGMSNARKWLSEIAGVITPADGRPEGQAVNVAVTHHGLLSLGLSADVATSFSTEFVSGMTVAHRSRILGDVGDSAPEKWLWGGPGTPPVDVLLMLYATDEANLETLYRTFHAGFARAGLEELHRLDTVDLGDVEPFTFANGISQPVIEGLQPDGRPADTIKPGEFVLGYPNEYGLYTQSPVVTDSNAQSMLPLRADGAGCDLGRNGTYLVFRQLAQDIAGFWSFLDQATRLADGTSDRKAATRLAAKIVGRWPGGAPLVLSPDLDDPTLAAANDFGYFNTDPHGLRCPLGAHIRRANPRDSLPPKPGTQASLDVTKRHRIIRRGREQRAAATSGPVDAPGSRADASGLHFICLNANIARQFEFIQGTWLNNAKFNGLYEEPDPLVSTRPGRTFRIPAKPVRTRITGLPPFVRVEGGGYFFLPGLRAIRYLASLGQ